MLTYQQTLVVPKALTLNRNDVWLVPVMTVAMFLSMILAGLSGTLIPLGLKLLGIDPALPSTVIITTITDILGFLICYSNLAIIWFGAISTRSFFGP
jgi:Mg/Co/Ni transporter MgtE